MIPIAAPWEPDKFDLDGAFTRTARNVYPAANSKRPIKSFEVFSPSTVLASDCKGLTFARQVTLDWQMYAAEQTKLRKYVGGSWSDYSGAVYSGPPVGDWWASQQFVSSLIFSNSTDNPQVLDVDSGATAFADLSGAPKCRFFRAVGDFLWAVGNPTSPYTAQWADIFSTTSWTPASGSLAGSQDFAFGGAVHNVFGDKSGFVLQEDGVQYFEFLPGSEYVYRFELLSGIPGSAAPYGSCSLGGTAFYYSRKGFVSLSTNGGPKPIGATRVDEWFKANSDPARRASMIAVADPAAQRVYFCFHSSAASTALDRVLIYDPLIDQWGEMAASAQFWAAVATPGVTLEDLDAYSSSLDTLSSSLDAPTWQGSTPTFGGINSARQLVFPTGENMEAVFETADFRAAGPNQRAFISEVEVVVDTDTATVRVGGRERLGDAVSYTAPSAINAMGKAPVRSSARFHRIEVTVPEGATWTHAQGVEPTAVRDGNR